uniref:cadherin-like domain-containing protein n=1 Tax=Pseudomonas sp. D(2018) TaxID=2502238 RepID=UPI0010F697F4
AEVGSLSLRVTATDGSLSATADFSLNIGNSNDAPTVSGPVTLAAGTEDVAYTLTAAGLLAHASDPDAGDVLSVTSVSVDPADGELVDNNDGTWTFTPALNRNGAVSFAVVIADAAGATVSTTASLQLAAVNDAPTLAQVIGAQSANEDSPFSFTVPADAFADVDGDALSYSATLANGEPLPAWLSFDPATRSFSGTPGNAEVGSLSLRVTATDGSLSATADFSLNIGNSNDAPTVSGPVTMEAGTEDVAYVLIAAQLLANASDVDAGDTLSVQNVSVDPADGELVDNGDGTWTFTPALDRNGLVNFSVVISDAAGATVNTSASAYFEPVDDAPTVVAAITALSEDSGVSATDFITNVAAQVVSGSYSGTLGADETIQLSVDGFSTWVVALTDPASQTWSASIILGIGIGIGSGVLSVRTVDSVGNATHGSSHAYLLDTSADIGGDLAVRVADPLIGDAEKTAVGYSIIGLDADTSATVTFSDGVNSVVGVDGSADLSSLADGPISVSVAATDAAGNSASGALQQARVLTFDDVAAGDELTTQYQFLGVSGTGAVVLTFAPWPTQSGANLVYSSDGFMAFDLDPAITGDVVAVSAYVSGVENTGLFAYDAGGNLVGQALLPAAAPANTLLNVASSGSPIVRVEIHNGGATFGVDDLSFSTAGSLTLDTSADIGGDLAVLLDDWLIGNAEKTAVGYSVTGLDADADATVTFSDGVNIVLGVDGVADLSSLADGAISVKVTATDTAGNSTTRERGGTQTLTLDDVANGNLGTQYLPRGVVASGAVVIEAASTLWPAHSGTRLAYSPTGLMEFDFNPAMIGNIYHLSAYVTGVENTGLFAYDSAGNLVGQSLLSVLSESNTLLTVTSHGAPIVKLAIHNGGASFAVDDLSFVASPLILDTTAPTVSGPVTLPEGSEDTAVNLSAAQLLATASDASALSIQSVSVDPADGSLAENGDGTWTFTPVLNRNGVASFAVVIVDAAGAAVHTSASLNLAPVNDAPTLAIALTDQTASEDSPFSFTVPADTFADVDGDALSYSATLANGDPLPSWLSFDPATRSFSGTPGNAEVGSLSLRVTATDGSLSASADFNLNIGNSNDAPEVSGPVTLAAGTEDVAYTLTAAELLAHASDQDAGDVLSVTSVSVDPADGELVDNGDGTWTFTPALNRHGAVSFAVVISDGTASVNTSASLDLQPVNDAPTGDVTLSGTATAGQVLTAGQTLADADGLGVISYQWQVSVDGNVWSDIVGANGEAFTLGAAEVGRLVRISANFTDGGGTLESVASAPTAAVAAAYNLIEGGPGNDTRNGTALADQILGLEGDDILFGGDGDDLLDGGAGSDLLDGGAGSDSAAFAGAMDQYTLIFDPRGYLAIQADAGSSEAGLDLVGRIEQLRFADGTLTVVGSPGGELRVNSTTVSDQYQPAITGLADGGYVVSWMSFGQDGNSWGIYAQRYAADGAAVGGEVRVNSTTLSDQSYPAISGLADGGYVVSWMSWSQDGSNYGIYVQRYAADGSAQSGEVQVNSTTLGDRRFPTVTGLSDGGYVVSWQSAGQDGSSWGIYAQRYTADGSAVGGELRVNSTMVSAQQQPTISGLADGGYVLSWMSNGQDGSGYGIYAQRYAADGAAVGGEVQVNRTTLNSQEQPTISSLADGGYVVSWISFGQDGSNGGIYAQRYASDGAAVGGEVRVNNTTFDSQQQPTISGLLDGGYVVSWASAGQDGSGWGIYAQRYATNGAAVGGEVRVNSTTLNHQEQPMISGLADGGYVVSWMSFDQDGSGWGVYAQRYDASGNPIENTLLLKGDAGNNVIRLGSGDERVLGGGGNDSLFGGDGLDVAVYQGSQQNFELVPHNLHVWVLTDLQAADGEEDVDTLYDFEALQFADGVRLRAAVGEVRINSTTALDQLYPTITCLADGGYVLSWMSLGQDSSGYGIYAQRYTANGAAMGGELKVNSTTVFDQIQPMITGLADGGYVLSWMSADGSGYGIYAQRYAADGTAVGGEMRVNSTTVSDQSYPTISGLANGDYVVSWMSADGSGGGIYAQRYAVDGSAVGGEVRVNSTAAGDQRDSTIIGLAGGGYVVSWMSFGQDGSSGGIYAQRYTSDGAPLGGEVRVNSTTVFDQIQPVISGLGDGGYVVSWMSLSQDGSGGGIYTQRYAADGTAVGGEVRVNSTTLNSQEQPTITGLADGGYVVSWMSFGQDGNGYGIYAQRYATNGAAVGGEVRVNSTTLSDQSYPTISGLADGGYVVSWTSLNQDGSGWGIYAQHFDANGNPLIGHLEWQGDATANIIRSSASVDWFTGGAGADSFQFHQLPGTRADHVTDFTSGSDVLALNSSVFNLNGQPIGAVFASITGAQTEQAGAMLLFNQGNQTLYYDADGTANGNAVAVVTLAGVASLAAGDLQLYA